MSLRSHMGSSMLPIMVTIIFPLLLLWLFPPSINNGPVVSLLSALIGVLLIIAGAFLLARCIQLFDRIGKGTLAPWNATQRMVITGPYRYVRNPMISGVLAVLLGESLFFQSPSLLLWFLVFLIGNHIYFIKSEEPGLEARFGHEFVVYKRNVPRWIPRRTPWVPIAESEDPHFNAP